MTSEEIIAFQKEERQKSLASILASKATKKIIIAGAGTGKTFTFKEVLKVDSSGANLAMTFIRMLVFDMNAAFGHLAEVKTFHAYCKKVLHEQNGKVELIPFLTKIIENDSQVLGLQLKDFDKKFQSLDEDSPEVKFYLKRGDYYEAVSFNDSVYQLYKVLQAEPDIVPVFNNILIDEYQDFNLLEVAFINELEKRGKILIVGDDDQAVYNGRGSSPDHLREKFNSGTYEQFELPFCSRCPEVIVNATNDFLSAAQKNGLLKGRVGKRYECYMESKKDDNARFPKIVIAQCTTGNIVAKYIDSVIQKIDLNDIKESWQEGAEYPTVLIVGHKQYLSIVQRELDEKYPQMKYKLNEEKPLSVTDGYDILLRDNKNNLGWRVIIDFYLKPKEIASIIQESGKGIPMTNIVEKEFVQGQKKALEIIRSVKKGEKVSDEMKLELKKIIENYYDQILEYYTPKEIEEQEKTDSSKPSILLSSFVGCKGLSAGYVIIIGANDSSIPKDPKHISDVEVAQLMVALTRTRKQCHIVSNKWLIAPKLKGKYQELFTKSHFFKWIPAKYINDKGLLSAKDIK